MKLATIERGVGIVGAGIAGTTAGIELAQRGIPVTVFERRKIGTGRFGPERSEMTINTALLAHDAAAAITTPITEVRALSLDNSSRDVTTRLTFDPIPENNPLVGIDHNSLVQILHGRLGNYPNVTIRDGTTIQGIHDTPDEQSGAQVLVDGHTETFGAVINGGVDECK